MLALNAGIGWHPEHIRDGRFGKWLEGNVDWAISRERYWGTPLPIWRCDDCDHVTPSARSPSCASAQRPPVAGRLDLHRPYVDDVVVACACGGDDAPRARGDRRLVRQRRDAVRAVPLPVRDGRRLRRGASRPTSSARRSTRRAAGSTRCSPRPRCCSTDRLPQRGLPRPDPRRRGPEDEQDQGQRRRALDRPRPPRRRRLPLVPPHRPEPVGLVPLQPRHGRRRRAPVPADALEHLRVPRHLRRAARRLGPGGPARRPAGAPRPIDRGSLSRLDGTTPRSPSARGLRRHRRGRAIEAFVDDLSQLVRAQLAPPLLGGRRGTMRPTSTRRAAFATLHECLVDGRPAVAPFSPFVADEIYGNLVAAHDPGAPERPPGRLARARRPPRPGSGGRDGRGPRGGRPRPRRPGRGKLKVRQPLAEAVVARRRPWPAIAGLERPHRGRAERQGGALRHRPGRAGQGRPSSRTTGRSAPGSASEMPAVAAAVAASRRRGGARMDAASGRDHPRRRRERARPDDLLREAHSPPDTPWARTRRSPSASPPRSRPSFAARAGARDRPRGQGARRAPGLRVEERIRLHLDGSGWAARGHRSPPRAIAAETLAERSASATAPRSPGCHEEHVLDGEPLRAAHRPG